MTYDIRVDSIDLARGARTKMAGLAWPVTRELGAGQRGPAASAGSAIGYVAQAQAIMPGGWSAWAREGFSWMIRGR